MWNNHLAISAPKDATSLVFQGSLNPIDGPSLLTLVNSDTSAYVCAPPWIPEAYDFWSTNPVLTVRSVAKGNPVSIAGLYGS